MDIYKAINQVQAELAKTGIVKDRKNQAQGYSFRGIDDVYNALAPLLASAELCILPRALSRESVERQTKSGSAMFYVTVDMEFDFVSAKDGSKHTVRTFGEAMDSADKATNKAMSAAYKYACFQAFSIPTEGDNDADANSHEIKPKQSPAPNLIPPPLSQDEVALCITAMNGCAEYEALKGIFGGAFKRSNDLQKKTLTDVYNAKKALLGVA